MDITTYCKDKGSNHVILGGQWSSTKSPFVPRGHLVMSGNFLGFNTEGRGKGTWDACCLAPDGELIGQPHGGILVEALL